MGARRHPAGRTSRANPSVVRPHGFKRPSLESGRCGGAVPNQRERRAQKRRFLKA